MAMEDDLRQLAEELRETHISWVFLTEDSAFKVKKPVELGFLDFRELDRRKEVCEAEVRLNRRLAPTVYHGLVPVRRDASGRHGFGGEGELVDWAVHMRRLPDSDRLDIRLRESRLTEAQLDALVERIACFHEEVGPYEAGELGGAETVEANVRQNFEQTREHLASYLSPAQCREIEEWQLSFIENSRELFDRRLQSGRVREGHGDLRCDHVYLSEEGEVDIIDIIDCIEFSEAFRIGDVCCDLVFLAMDLAYAGRADLAERVMAIYARESNDYDLYELADFYESYRAFVRGKIAAFIAAGTSSPETRESAIEDARRHFLLALASERRSALPPVVVAVGGIIASGKSTVSKALARELSAPIVNADRTRKFMAGVEAMQQVDDGAFSGMYSLEFTEKVYREVIRRAEVVALSGRPVILDASFRPRWARELAAKLAERLSIAFLFVECSVDEQTCLARLAERDKQRGVSDGRTDIFADFVKKWERVDELSPEQHLVLDTAESLESNIERVRGVMATWPRGLTG